MVARMSAGGSGARGPAAVAGLLVSASLGLAFAAAGVLTAQGLQARHRIGRRRTAPPYADGRYGQGRGPSIRIAVLGDSGAAGLGAQSAHDTMGAVIAAGVAQTMRRGVVLQNHAVVGAVTADLDAQIDRALWSAPHVAVIFIGGNDVTHLVPRQRSAAQLSAAVARLRSYGTAVVVGTCPDLGTVRPIPQPLRAMMRRRSRQLAAAQASATAGAGGAPVALGALLGPEFEAAPEMMFSADRFHPSAQGYTAAAQVMLPAVLEALGAGQVPAVID